MPKPAALFCLALFLLACLAPAPAGADALTVAVSKDFPPFAGPGKTGPVGLEPDLARALCGQMERACQLKALSPQAAASLLAAGGDAFAVSALLPRPAAGAAQPGPVFLLASSSFLGRQGVGPVVHPHDLRYTVIGCLDNSPQEAYLKKTYGAFSQILTFSRRAGLARALAEGRVDLLFDDTFHNLNLLTRLGNGWEIIEPFLSRAGLGGEARLYAARGNQALALALEKAFQALLQKEAYQAIMDHYSPVPLY